jgi:integrase
MSNAWIYQKTADVKNLSDKDAPYYVGWYEPDGRRKGKCCGEGFHGKKNAEKLKRKIESELMTGTYQMHSRKLWPDFRKEYERRVLEGMAILSRPEVKTALDHFERIIKPVRVFAINTQHVDDFIAARRQEQGRRAGVLLSPATLNKDLRHVKAALGKAVEWGYLSRLPRFHMEREPRRIPSYCPPEHFALIYQACEEAARWPENQPYPAADWWRGLLMTAYMTGWRIGALLALRREDVDLEAGTAFSHAADNKGKRDQLVPLHPVVVEHLKRLAGFTPVFFPWSRSRRAVFEEFERIQKAAGVKPERKERYGFHDLRRAFATMNAGTLSPDALQALMQHRAYTTTQGYINLARQLKPAAHNLFVPDVGPIASKAAYGN